MKYIYLYIWIGLGIAHVWFVKILYPLVWILVKIGKKTDKGHKSWEKEFNKTVLDFPGGTNDWFAYGIIFFLFLIPVIIISAKYQIDIYSNKFHFGSIAIIVAAFCYYWLYFRSRDWLKKQIDIRRERYYVSLPYSFPQSDPEESEQKKAP